MEYITVRIPKILFLFAFAFGIFIGVVSFIHAITENYFMAIILVICFISFSCYTFIWIRTKKLNY